MRQILILFFLGMITTVAAQGRYINEDNEEQQWGKISVADLKSPPFDSWYNESLQYYNPGLVEGASKKIDKIKNLEVLIYMGTWCSDSQDWVPKFIKLWELLDLSMTNVKIIGVHDADDKRKQAPDGSEKIYNIEMVPTFIFLDGKKELGRIVEFPEGELEDDVFKILKVK